MTYTYRDANGIVHMRTITVAGYESVSLVKRLSHVDRAILADRARTDVGDQLEGWPRVELLGNASFGKIVRPEFGGQCIADGTLKPLTGFTA